MFCRPLGCLFLLLFPALIPASPAAPLPAESTAVVGGQAGASQQAPRGFEAVAASLPNVRSVEGTADGNEITIRWQAYAATSGALIAPAAAAPVNTFDVISERAAPRSPVRERHPELSDDQIVLLLADAGGRLVGWQAMSDPRIIRAESPSADGQWTGVVLHRAQADFTVNVPPSLGVVEVRICQPRWTGSEWLLEDLGSARVPAR